MNTTQQNYVCFQHVQKTYDGKNLVVKDFNLDIAPGEFVTMLGPSGSGKTTCLMMLAGFETATGGEIYIDGVAVNHLAPHKRDIGMVFQNYALFPHMTIVENLAFPLKVRKLSSSQVHAKVTQALDMVELAHVANRYPKQLSGGQQQRVALARALVFEPKLVLMDEPLGALDKQLREQMQMEIKHLHEKLGITILYVTHDQTEALTMSDRIAVFNDGAVQQLATPTELYESPSNAFVAQFIGENNQLCATVEQLQGDVCTVSAGDYRLRARRVCVDTPGQETVLSVRPEKISIQPERDGCDNLVEGCLREQIYHGDHYRLVVEVASLGVLVLKVPNNTRDTQPLIPGHICRIGWHSQDCHALDCASLDKPQQVRSLAQEVAA
ncbi:ABC transporter ATP-binding protein [Vibrio proteolyticus]|uniref:Spermidine/putrescine import ATP-binding protein PotA n=1 Tax=Vibrio proteolyticus NBRC 13287 TaxID=1219065 RepID=U2ZY22_VIBPR|nr:ABC transporter ATP-binding protein [Vibrio proteolyticus]GAD65997.1 putative polyamine ABC transporter ATP-binding protein [Vibrio proteolyticus NBRC 13287]